MCVKRSYYDGILLGSKRQALAAWFGAQQNLA